MRHGAQGLCGLILVMHVHSPPSRPPAACPATDPTDGQSRCQRTMAKPFRTASSTRPRSILPSGPATGAKRVMQVSSRRFSFHRPPPGVSSVWPSRTKLTGLRHSVRDGVARRQHSEQPRAGRGPVGVSVDVLWHCAPLSQRIRVAGVRASDDDPSGRASPSDTYAALSARPSGTCEAPWRWLSARNWSALAPRSPAAATRPTAELSSRTLTSGVHPRTRARHASEVAGTKDRAPRSRTLPSARG